MLNRFAELRKSAEAKGLDAASTTSPIANVGESAAPQLPTNVDVAVKEILDDDRSVWKSIRQIQAHTGMMRELSIEVFHTVLPTELQKLQAQLDDEDRTCNTLIRRCKELLVDLEGSGGEEVPVAQSMRQNLHRHATKAFRKQLQFYMTLRNDHRAAMAQQARRRLRLAFPEATADDLDTLLERPELASEALSRRVEGGWALQTLLEEEKANENSDMARLAREAEELKALFVQFAELVNQQGEQLDAIEACIHHVVEETEVTVEVLHKAKAERKKLQRTQLCGLAFFGVIIILFLWWLVSKFYPGAHAGKGTSQFPGPDAGNGISQFQTEMLQAPWPAYLKRTVHPQRQQVENPIREQQHVHRQQQQNRLPKQQMLFLEQHSAQNTDHQQMPEQNPQQEMQQQQLDLQEPVLQFQNDCGMIRPCRSRYKRAAELA